MGGEYSMHKAAESGDLEGVERLIERGVSVDSRDDEGRTPLHWAAYCGRYEVAELLINNRCNVNLKDRNGLTPVLSAVRFWNWKKDIIHLLLQSGAQVNCADDDGWTLLHYASHNGWADVVQRIVERGVADLNAAKLGGGTPLMTAADSGHEDVAALLLRAGADAHPRDAEKKTAVHCASWGGHTKVVQVLLEEEGLDLNPQDWKGNTPLHKACFHGCAEIVKQLLTAGADTNMKNNNGWTALRFSIRNKKSTLEEVRLFVQHGFFFEEYDYALILKNPVLKDRVLKDVDLCTQSIVNRFHRQSLPALYSNPNFAKKLPSIEKFKLSAGQMHEVENFVKCDIQANTFCDIIKARPLVLGVLCVHSLLAYQSDVKRSASSSFSDSNCPFKKTRHN